MGRRYGWAPYVPVAKRREQARKKMNKLRKQGLQIEPVEIEGRKIAKTFWGAGWCAHLETFSDYENRLPRGRTYVRNGSVCHLEISPGCIKAMVSGSSMYNIDINISSLPEKNWVTIKEQCAGGIGSLLELLQGKFSAGVMKVVTDRKNGLFPAPAEIKLRCDCPDVAVMCKHVAAVLYGVGARLDEKPELLFLLRGVDHEELIIAGAEAPGAVTAGTGKSSRRRVAVSEVADVFGIDLTEEKAVPEETAEKLTEEKAALRKTAEKLTEKRAAQRETAEKERDEFVEINPDNITGDNIKRLREKFDMSRSEFARLLQVAQPTVCNWEKSSGKLNLRKRTRESLLIAAELSPEEARKEL